MAASKSANGKQHAEPVGRPTDYHPKYCKIVEDLMIEGASIKEVAWHLRRSRQTIYEWAEKFPEFGDTLKQSVEFANGWWEHMGRINVNNKDFNSTLWYMNMKNRYGYTDKTESTHNVTVRQEDAIKDLG